MNKKKFAISRELNKSYYNQSITTSEENFIVESYSSLSENKRFDVYIENELIFTDTLYNARTKFNRIFDVLVSAIKSLKLTQDYNGIYIAYLTSQLSEEEFTQETQRYSYTPIMKLHPEILENIKILFNKTKLEFTPSDIADIFQLDYEKASEAIANLKNELKENLNVK